MLLVPLKLASIALAGRTYFLKNSKDPSAGILPKPRLKRIHTGENAGSLPNPMQNLVKGLSASLSNLSTSLTGLTSSVSKIIQKSPKEDYAGVINGFLPENAEILKPHSSRSTAGYHLADLDGDSQNELIASYRQGNNINTIILKKHDGYWGKINEITNSDYDSLNYVGFADITGEGRKQMLLGLKKSNKPGELYGYTLRDGKATELFTHRYNRLEVLNTQPSRGSDPKSQLVFWSKHENGIDNIEIKHWKDNELKPVQNPANYYNKRVLPIYGQKVKQEPKNPLNWYKLADALTKAGLYRDGLESVNIGISLNPASPSKEEFLELKTTILEKMKKQ